MKNLNILPTCYDYSRFLERAVFELNISINEARRNYGLYTYKQWFELLNKWKYENRT